MSHTDECLASPRLNAIYNLGENSSLRAAWGFYYQSEEMDGICIGDGENNFYPAEKAEHRIIGFHHTFKNGINFRLEGYYKKYSNLHPENKNTNYTLEPFPEFVNNRNTYFRAGSVSKGIELYLKKEMHGKFSWWFSYSLASVRDSLEYVNYPLWQRSIYNDKVLPGITDQRHTIYLDLGYRPNQAWLFNLSWHYRTGWPYTDMEEYYYYNGAVWLMSDLRGARFEPYNRIDLRLNRYFNIGRGRVTIFIELLNALGNKNIRNYDFKDYEVDGFTELEKKPEYWLGRLPSAGISYQINF